MKTAQQAIVNEFARTLGRGLCSEDKQMIENAVCFANQAHKRQVRCSGQPYIFHPLAVAIRLSLYRQTPAVIAAAILHDTVEDCNVSLESITAGFGREVTFLVDGMTKIVRDGATDASATLNKILKYAKKDPRLVLIKLCDVAHNMSEVQYLPPEKQYNFCKKAVEHFIPMADEYGYDDIKAEIRSGIPYSIAAQLLGVKA